MHNVHICSRCSDLVEVSGNVVRSIRIGVPVCINAIGTGRYIGHLLFTIVGVIKSFPALEDDMANLATQLTLGSVVVVGTSTTSATSRENATPTAATTTTP
jgi:hypothetical protein